MSVLQFEGGARHLYRWGGLPVGSVTQIISKAGLGTDYSGVPPDILARAARNGTTSHQILAFYGAKPADERPEPEQFQVDTRFPCPVVRQYVAAGLRFLHDFEAQGMVVEAREEMLYSEEFGFAGTRDLRVVMGTGHRWILDYKTIATVNRPAAEVQLGAYSILGPEPVDFIGIVSLGTDGNYKFITRGIDLERGRSRFLWALEQVSGYPAEAWLDYLAPETG